MNRISRSVWLLAVVALVLSSPALARASVVLGLDASVNGDRPLTVQGSAPALTATFANTGTNTVTLTLDATNLLSREFVRVWLFNFNGNAALLSIAPVVAPLVSITRSATLSENGGSQVKAGLFNLAFNFNTKGSRDRFNGGDTMSFTITGTGVTENSFTLGSAAEPGRHGHVRAPGGWLSAADLQGIPDRCDGSTSGSIGTRSATVSPLAVVPEPSTLSLAILGGVGLIGLRCRRRPR